MVVVVVLLLLLLLVVVLVLVLVLLRRRPRVDRWGGVGCPIALLVLVALLLVLVLLLVLLLQRRPGAMPMSGIARRGPPVCSAVVVVGEGAVVPQRTGAVHWGRDNAVR